MQIYPLIIPKSSLGACVKNLPWPPSSIQDELCCKRISCDLFPNKSSLWSACLPNSDQQQEKRVLRARGSHLVMAVISSQVKGNSDAPSSHQAEASWLSALISQYQLSKEGPRLSFHGAAAWTGSAAPSPSVPGWACRVGEPSAPQGSQIQAGILHGNISSRAGRHEQGPRAAGRGSAHPLWHLPAPQRCSWEFHLPLGVWICVDTFRPGSLFSMRV